MRQKVGYNWCAHNSMEINNKMNPISFQTHSAGNHKYTNKNNKRTQYTV